MAKIHFLAQKKPHSISVKTVKRERKGKKLFFDHFRNTRQ